MEGERVPTCPLVSQVGSRTQLEAVRALASEGLTNVSGVTGAPEGGEQKEDPWGPQEAAAAAVRVQRCPELPRPLAKKPGRPRHGTEVTAARVRSALSRVPAPSDVKMSLHGKGSHRRPTRRRRQCRGVRDTASEAATRKAEPEVLGARC